MDHMSESNEYLQNKNGKGHSVANKNRSFVTRIIAGKGEILRDVRPIPAMKATIGSRTSLMK